MADTTVDATRRLNVKKQTLDDAYAAPANFLEIDVINPITHGLGKKRYTDYEVRMRVSIACISLSLRLLATSCMHTYSVLRFISAPAASLSSVIMSHERVRVCLSPFTRTCWRPPLSRVPDTERDFPSPPSCKAFLLCLMRV